MKSPMPALGLALMLLSAPAPVFAAGIPVIDSASLSQDAMNYAKQLMEMANQLKTMKDQLEQQIKQYTSLIGDRGMGGLLDGQIRNYIPDDWKSAMAILDKPNGYGGISENVSRIIEENKVIPDEQLSRMSPSAREQIEAERRALATHKALSEEAFKNASERFEAIQQLTNSIGAATDPKAILDLQARIESEQTSLANEGIKLQAMAEALRAEEMARQQQSRERAIMSGGSIRDLNL